jgi:hypothetical protein
MKTLAFKFVLIFLSSLCFSQTKVFVAESWIDFEKNNFDFVKAMKNVNNVPVEIIISDEKVVAKLGNILREYVVLKSSVSDKGDLDYNVIKDNKKYQIKMLNNSTMRYNPMPGYMLSVSTEINGENKKVWSIGSCFLKD